MARPGAQGGREPLNQAQRERVNPEPRWRGLAFGSMSGWVGERRGQSRVASVFWP